jgi:4-hydroxy-3-methylbut-2-enyl diphosphate reductase IspH
MTFDESLATRLNRFMTTTGKTLRDISEETQIPSLWLARVKNGVLASTASTPEDLSRTKRLALLLESQETKKAIRTALSMPLA